MENLYYIRLISNNGKNRTVVLGFVNEKQADDFINLYKNFGGINQFEVNFFGYTPENLLKDLVRENEKLLLKCKNSIKTAKFVNENLF